MALDGLVIRALTDELQAYIGGRIGKIYQPAPSDIVMQIRSRTETGRLLLSANPTYPRIHITRQTYQNPLEAPMFCMLLRKHCEGALIEAVEQEGMERIIRIRVRQRDELGDVSFKTIVVEIMGRHSNIILLDPSTGTILDGIQHVTPAISSHRLVLPGSAYVEPPAQGKRNPLETKEAEFLLLWKEDPESDAQQDRLIVDRFSGVSPLVAREIVHRAAGGESEDPDVRANLAEGYIRRLWSAFASVMDPIRRHEYAPAIVTDAANRMHFSVVALTHIGGDSQSFPSVSECLESFYGDKAERDSVKQRTADLQRFLVNERGKNSKKLEKLQETLEDARDADRYRILGELLTASMHLMNKGDRQVSVVNYYDENQNEIDIELDPLLTPSRNAQRYFRKYTKMKNSLGIVGEQIQSTQEEIRYLDSLIHQLGAASLADIGEIRDELTEQGYIRDKRKRGAKKKKKDAPALAGFLSSEGIPILVGKNNTQNDYLTNRLARPGETWLHTKEIPGSHVVIRESSFGETTLHEAAQLAAYYSQGKDSSRIPVDYTLIRHVRKPAGAKPGYVIYDNQKTLYVTPDENAVKALRPLTAK